MKTRRDFLKSLMIGGVAALVPSAGFARSVANQKRKPNVVMIVCDDLNDYVTGMAGHPQARTPHITKLAQSGVAFKRAYSNNPICAPSRSSFLTSGPTATIPSAHHRDPASLPVSTRTLRKTCSGTSGLRIPC